MRHGSLFSGIGGFDLASEWMGWENIFQVEWDKYCQKVLAKNFPKVKRYEDIKQFNGSKYKGSVDIISGGFPCQPFSQAGKRKGTKDDRYLWPEMLRVITEIKPSFVVGENVAGLLSMENGKTLERILADLEDEGYEVESFIIPACGVGAWHRRDRLWIIAYTDSIRCNYGFDNNRQNSRKCISNKRKDGQENDKKRQSKFRTNQNNQIVTDTVCKGLQEPTRRKFGCIQQKKRSPQGSKFGGAITKRRIQREAEPKLGRVVHGVSSKLDSNRIKALGNTIDPYLAYEIFKAIEQLACLDG